MATTVNAAIAGLISQFNVSTDLDGVTVFDGWPGAALDDDNDSDDQASAWVTVGYQPGQSDSVVIEYDWAQIGAQRSEERYDILCALAVMTGDDSLTGLRTRAIAVRDAVAAALSVDRTLGGSVRLAHISASTLYQERTPQGISVGFAFTVSVQARITT